ncbi:formate dehydrogenase accessory sulfurtransferase FdhD [Candidatus Amarolinea dominans]|uniref:formate dehydrogenase accessory sulfurtransferase FdhD n=1 Tax=Candidatus Amarolinea dominans TaxID=3140696 RepID=UPI001DCBE29F|nr:formate dehydrogenase accessory sulfurtransferase FdhD [Anaerolineae bacterium]
MNQDKWKSDKLMDGLVNCSYAAYERGSWRVIDGAAPGEEFLRLHVNGLELATLMCSPFEQDTLALGFLRAEGIIQSMDDVRLVTICPSGTCVDVWLRNANFEPPRRVIITSGCGGGVTFDDLAEQQAPLTSARQLAPEQLIRLMSELQEAAVLYRTARGIHTSGLSDGDQVLMAAQDVGRHNTVDRLWGQCLRRRQPTDDLILLSTGRISSEMLNKAAKMRIAIVASRTSPTALSIELAHAWNITLVGYVRTGGLRAYTAPERLGFEEIGDRRSEIGVGVNEESGE